LEVGEQKTGSHQTWVLYLFHLLGVNQWNITKSANHALLYDSQYLQGTQVW
jgi:hypothetical protein